MVGQQASIPPLHHSLSGVQNAFGNNSSGTGQAQGLPQSTVGQAAIGNDGGLGQASGQVGGQVNGPLGSLGQASGPPGALGTNGGLGQTAAGASHGVMGNMPSTGIATTTGASGLLVAATSSSRPSSSRPSTGSSQVYGPLVTPAKSHGGYPPALQNYNASQGYGQTLAGPSAPLNPKLSVTSVASTSSVYSNSSYIGNSSRNPTITKDNSGSVPPLPSMEASSRQQQQQYQQHHRRNSFGRVAQRQVTNNAGYEYSPYAEIGSSSMGGGGSSSQEAPIYDEEGRPLNMPSEKVPLVHLDGALYQEGPRDDARSGYEPPAYIE